MGYIASMKRNVKRKREEKQRIQALGRIVFNGKLREMPKDLQRPGYRYKEIRNHGMFGQSKNIVVEMRRRARRT